VNRRKLRHRSSIVAGAALLFAMQRPALADAPRTDASSDSRALAEMLFFTARGMMEAGRYEGACVKLAESYRLDPAAGTLLNLAVCHEKEGKIASAWGEFRQALSDARKASRADREELARDHLGVVEPELPMLSIDVPRGMRVTGLEVTRNGVPLLDAAWATELPIDPGTVEITARAPGFKPRTKTLTIAKRQHMSVALEPLEIAPVEVPPPDFWTGKRKLGVVLAGAYFFFTGGSKEERGPKGIAQESPWTVRVNAGPAGAQGFVSRSF
jgi:tetratricopeptide (TPR) repeat protein